MTIKKVISIILVVIWMIVVFLFSAQQGEGSGNTSRLVATKIIEVVQNNKTITQEEKDKRVDVIEPYIRKVAHYSVYLLGGLLIANAMGQVVQEEKKIALYSVLMGVFYAASDEIHQLFIPERSGRVVDVVIDSFGIFTGIAVFLVILKITKAIRKRTNEIKGVE